MMPKLDISEEDVRRMYFEEGMTQREIADYYGVNHTTVISRLQPEKTKKRLRNYQKEHKGEIIILRKEYREDHKEEIKEYSSQYQKEHKEQLNLYLRTGLQGLRHKIRVHDNQNKQYQWLKRGLGREVHIHHEWIPETDKYSFSALVDASEHQHGIINPIIILEDNIIELLQDSS